MGDVGGVGDSLAGGIILMAGGVVMLGGVVSNPPNFPYYAPLPHPILDFDFFGFFGF